MHDSLCPGLGPPLPKPPGCLSPVLAPAPHGGVGVCLGVDLVLLLPGATSQGSQAPQASRQPLTHSSWRPALPALAVGSCSVLSPLPCLLPQPH